MGEMATLASSRQRANRHVFNENSDIDESVLAHHCRFSDSGNRDVSTFGVLTLKLFCNARREEPSFFHSSTSLAVEKHNGEVRGSGMLSDPFELIATMNDIGLAARSAG